MSIAVKTQHVHEYKRTLQKVPLRNGHGVISGLDILKHRVCGCGKVETYDVVRAKAYV